MSTKILTMFEAACLLRIADPEKDRENETKWRYRFDRARIRMRLTGFHQGKRTFFRERDIETAIDRMLKECPA